jgi:hypothetical protein
MFGVRTLFKQLALSAKALFKWLASSTIAVVTHHSCTFALARSGRVVLLVVAVTIVAILPWCPAAVVMSSYCHHTASVLLLLIASPTPVFILKSSLCHSCESTLLLVLELPVSCWSWMGVVVGPVLQRTTFLSLTILLYHELWLIAPLAISSLVPVGI